METMMFTFGVLTMVVVAIATVAVYSAVMVLKQKKQIQSLQLSIDNIYRDMMSGESELNRYIHSIQTDSENNIGELRSYVDRRFDKMVDTYFMVKEAEKEAKKQLIKG